MSVTSRLLRNKHMPGVPPGGGGGLLFIDNFNRADAVTLGPNWVTVSAHGWTVMEIVSNRVSGANNYQIGAYHSTDCDTTDQYAQIAWDPAAGEMWGPSICSDGSGALAGYSVNLQPWNGAMQLRKAGTDVANLFATPNITALVAPGVVRIEKVGNVIECFLNGNSGGTWTDTGTALSGLKVGFAFSVAGAAADDFEGGDL